MKRSESVSQPCLTLYDPKDCSSSGFSFHGINSPGSNNGVGSNGTPLQYSCLENPMDGEAWWAAVHRVKTRWTQLKWLSKHARTWMALGKADDNVNHSMWGQISGECRWCWCSLLANSTFLTFVFTSLNISKSCNWNFLYLSSLPLNIWSKLHLSLHILSLLESCSASLPSAYSSSSLNVFLIVFQDKGNCSSVPYQSHIFYNPLLPFGFCFCLFSFSNTFYFGFPPHLPDSIPS